MKYDVIIAGAGFAGLAAAGELRGKRVPKDAHHPLEYRREKNNYGTPGGLVDAKV